jgi:hypothetical protein
VKVDIYGLHRFSGELFYFIFHVGLALHKDEINKLVCLPLYLRFAGSNLAKDDIFFRVIKICSMTSFGGEVKPLVPCHKILQRVKEPYKYEKEYLIGKIHDHFLQGRGVHVTGVSAAYTFKLNKNILSE